MTTEDEARAAAEALSLLDAHPYLNHPAPPSWIKLETREARVIQSALRALLASRVSAPPTITEADARLHPLYEGCRSTAARTAFLVGWRAARATMTVDSLASTRGFADLGGEERP